MSISTVILVLFVFFLALAKPHWGTIIVISLLPIEAILPPALSRGVPLFTSPISLLGGIVLVGALLNATLSGRFHIERIFTNAVQVASLLFIGWFTLMHPLESWSGSDRNYVFTFVQLWSLLWLSSTVLKEERHQKQLMVLFAFACFVSAFVSISGGEVAATRDESLRSAGMMSGLNTAARYYVVGFVFLIYLRIQSTDIRVRWFASAGAVIMLATVAFVQSRAGVGLALLSILLLVAFGPKVQRKKYLAYLIGTILLVVLLLPSGLLDSIRGSFFTEESRPRERYQSIDENIRYDLWYAGLKMCRDNPIGGIGIGQFPIRLNDYLPGLIPGKFGRLASHNMFVRVLAETGIVGFALFIAILWGALRSLNRARIVHGDRRFQIVDAWSIVLIVILAGGLFKDDHADKMFWLFLGIASSFGASLKAQMAHTLNSAFLMTSPKPHAGPPPSSRDETNQGNATSSR